jgi:hypothetical protein
LIPGTVGLNRRFEKFKNRIASWKLKKYLGLTAGYAKVSNFTSYLRLLQFSDKKVVEFHGTKLLNRQDRLHLETKSYLMNFQRHGIHNSASKLVIAISAVMFLFST